MHEELVEGLNSYYRSYAACGDKKAKIANLFKSSADAIGWLNESVARQEVRAIAFKNNCSPQNIAIGIRFVGDVDQTDNPDFDLHTGDAAVQNGMMFVRVSNRWEKLGTEWENDSVADGIRSTKKLRNCKNCGAPAGHRDYCEYCGSTLYYTVP